MMLLETEFEKIDDALGICCSMAEDLCECLSAVQDMNRKYNAPGRYIISMEPFAEDFPLRNSRSTDLDATSVRSCDFELDMLRQLYGARSSQELDNSYVDVRYKFIKLKRDIEATLFHFLRIIDCAGRQEKHSPTVLKSTQNGQRKLRRD